MMRRLLMLAVLVTIAVLVIQSVPDMRRYKKIRSM
jgi:uncharacterized protein DUF6893